jgi:hypothetical protein
VKSVGDRLEKIERHCSIGHSPQCAVTPMEEEGNIMSQTLTSIISKYVTEKCLILNQIMVITIFLFDDDVNL